MTSKRKRAYARYRRRHKNPIQRLPNELIALILEHAVGRCDPQSSSAAYVGRRSRNWLARVKALSYVCKLWRSLLLPELFKIIYLSDTGRHRHQDLSCILFDNAAIRRSIRGICLSGRGWPETQITPLDNVAFARLLIDLVALQDLTLKHMCLSLPDRNLLLQISKRIALRRLHLDHVSVHHPSGQADMLSTVLGILPVSAIDHLETNSAYGYIENRNLPCNPAHGWRSQDVVIRALTLDRPCSTADHFKYLQSALAPGCLRSVQMKWGRWNDGRAMASLLRLVGHNVETLDISFTTLLEFEESAERRNPGTPSSIPWDTLRDAVEACPRLRVLRICTLPRRSYDEGPFTPGRYLLWKAVVTGLPSTIEEVIHRLHMRWDTGWYDRDTLQLWGIDALDRLASSQGRTGYPRLQKVLVEHEIPEFGVRDAEYAVMTRAIEDMPQLKAAGLLKFLHLGWLSIPGEVDANEFDQYDWD